MRIGWCVKFWIQPSDMQALPRKIGEKVKGVSETHEYRNVTYATTVSYTALPIPYIWNLSFKQRFHMYYANLTKNGK